MTDTNNFDAVQKAILNYDTYVPRGSYGVTGLESPRYKVWVEKNNPGVDCTPLTSKIDAKIGTGFHTLAEEAMNNSGMNVVTEMPLNGTIEGYDVGGTCDLVLLDDDEVATVADFKTMKAFPAKKALNGEVDKFIKQLSIYAYLLRQKGQKVETKGFIYVFVVGWTMRDKAIPRTFRLDLDLMTDEEVEAYVTERIGLLGDGDAPKHDCPVWQCKDYCGVRDVCPHFNHSEFGDES